MRYRDLFLISYSKVLLVTANNTWTTSRVLCSKTSLLLASGQAMPWHYHLFFFMRSTLEIFLYDVSHGLLLRMS